MIRDKWTATVPASRVAAAAEHQARHHRDREKWWATEAERAEKDFRETGMEMREMPVTSGYRVDPVWDPQKKERMEEARAKMASHRKQAEEYENYAAALGIIGGDVAVDVNDIQFFRLFDL